MKFLLVRPHAHLPTSKWLQSMITLEPYAQELIASAILPPHEVEICDLILPKNPIEFFKETLERFKPDFVGFGGFSSQFNANKELAGITKKIEAGYFDSLGVNTIWFSPIVKNPETAFGLYPNPKTTFSATGASLAVVVSGPPERTFNIFSK